jgi:hypothetical protein
MKEPTLSDLTKEELITLIQERIFRIEPDAIAFIIWKRKTKQAMDVMEKANEKLKTLDGSKDFAAWDRINQEWDSASRQYDVANKEWEKWR